MQGLALLAASSRRLSAAGFQGNGIDHVSLYVSNLQRSTDFYQRVFGSAPAGKVDHIAIGVDNFNLETVTADLKARGAAPQGRPQQGAVGFHILDPDGFPLQIISSSNIGSQY